MLSGGSKYDGKSCFDSGQLRERGEKITMAVTVRHTGSKILFVTL